MRLIRIHIPGASATSLDFESDINESIIDAEEHHRVVSAQWDEGTKCLLLWTTDGVHEEEAREDPT